MKPLRWLGALLVVLALGGCVQAVSGQEQPTSAPYSRDNEGMNRGPDM